MACCQEFKIVSKSLCALIYFDKIKLDELVVVTSSMRFEIYIARISQIQIDYWGTGIVPYIRKATLEEYLMRQLRLEISDPLKLKIGGPKGISLAV